MMWRWHIASRHWKMACPLLLANQWPAGVSAQIAVDSIASSQTDLGLVVSAASGDTIFRISPADGSVTPLSGNGVRPAGGMVRALVTMTCTGGGCASAEDMVTISAAGNTGRVLPLTNFTVADGINPPVITQVTGADPLTFTVAGIPDGEMRDFYVGADFGVDDSGVTGDATASFTVEVSSGAKGGSLHATIFRPISLSKLTNLSFGRVIPSTSVDGSVHMDAVTGTLSATGTGTVALDTLAPGFAQFQVKGEGGQSFAIDVQDNVLMSSGTNSLTVTTSTNADEAPVLGGSLGEEGSYDFRVGGSFDVPVGTPPGTYAGSFSVTVEYN